MEAPASLLKWKFQLDNPTTLGWTVVAAYLSAAYCCGRAALKLPGDSPRSFVSAWWVFAGALTFLGINKQLNLQTLMIVIGRNVSNVGDWYGERRRIQLIFSASFALLALGALAWFLWRFLEFFKKNHLALAGGVVLGLFVVMRAASINHAFALPIFGFKDDQWAWVLEIIGSLLIAAGALRSTADGRPE